MKRAIVEWPHTESESLSRTLHPKYKPSKLDSFHLRKARMSQFRMAFIRLLL